MKAMGTIHVVRKVNVISFGTKALYIIFYNKSIVQQG